MIAWLAVWPIVGEDGVVVGSECVHLHTRPGTGGPVWEKWCIDYSGDWWLLAVCDQCYRTVRRTRWRRRHG